MGFKWKKNVQGYFRMTGNFVLIQRTVSFNNILMKLEITTQTRRSEALNAEPV